ncbi:MAG: hypothetical protein R8K20_08690 [Gallionellaceae bacterium]
MATSQKKDRNKIANSRRVQSSGSSKGRKFRGRIRSRGVGGNGTSTPTSSANQSAADVQSKVDAARKSGVEGKPLELGKKFGKARKIVNKVPVLNKDVGSSLTGKAAKAIGKAGLNVGKGFLGTAGNILGSVPVAVATAANIGLNAGDYITGGETSRALKNLRNDPNSFISGTAAVADTVMHPIEAFNNLFPDIQTANAAPTRPTANPTVAAQSNANGGNKPVIPAVVPALPDAAVPPTTAPVAPVSTVQQGGLFNGATRTDPTHILDNGNVQEFGLSGPNGTVLPAPRGKGTFSIEPSRKPDKIDLQSVLQNIRHDKLALSEAGNPLGERRARERLASDIAMAKILSGNSGAATNPLADAKTRALTDSALARTENARNLRDRETEDFNRTEMAKARSSDAELGSTSAVDAYLSSIGINVKALKPEERQKAVELGTKGATGTQILDFLNGMKIPEQVAK